MLTIAVNCSYCVAVTVIFASVIIIIVILCIVTSTSKSSVTTILTMSVFVRFFDGPKTPGPEQGARFQGPSMS